MNKLIDVVCDAGHQHEDVWVRDDAYPACPTCGATTVRLWKMRATAAVIGDDIPGGLEIRNGLCNADGSPRRYYSKSEMHKEAARRGLVNHVTHVPPDRGSDRAPHTKRWI